MTTAIVAQLKTGTYTNVVPFGRTAQNPPYVVVKPEFGPGQTRLFRIFLHVLPSQQILLEDYIFDELTDLLSEFQGTDRNGNVFKLLPTDEFSDFAVTNDDDTLSMERVFLVPQRLY